MVLFGELVIPSSRVLWDDEDEYEQFTANSQTVEWHGQNTAPSEIYHLLIIETKKLSQIARNCLQKNSKPICSLPKAAVSIYKLKENDYLVLCEDGKDVIPGEITEKLIPWIENAKIIIAVTSNSAAMYQKNNSEELPNCFIKSLSTGETEVFASKLEAPNLVTGIAAGVLSYCQHMGISASLYICYSDSRPLDSITAAPIVDLLRKFKISTDKSFSFKPVFETDSNLYM